MSSLSAFQMLNQSEGFPIQRRCSFQLILASLSALALAGGSDHDDNDDEVTHCIADDNDDNDYDEDNAFHVM